MLFGLVIKLINLIKQKKKHVIYTSWIPEFLFMFSFFGYMLFCIVYKMVANWSDGKGGYLNPPSLINLLISIFLSPGTIKTEAQLFNNLGT
jgi:V-type H+-transporting ATPase subunit a